MRLSVALLFLAAMACEREPTRGEILEGEAGGGAFRVKLAERLPEGERAEVGRVVVEALERVSSRTSLSLPESDLSRLHRAAAGIEVPVSVETLEMMREAARVSELTQGAFDVTVAPVARLFGFVPGGPAVSGPPREEEVERERARVGFRQLALDDDSIAMTKRIEGLELDLSALSTGYALDLAAVGLEERGYRDYLIEQGAYFRTRGKDAAGEPWRVPIVKPGPPGEIQRNVSLSGFSMATAEDDRGAGNGFAEKLHGHLVDPRSGRPLDHGLLSVTVLGETCLAAGALATGLLVLGPDEGFRLASEEDIAALFLVRSDGGRLEERATPSFAELFF